MVILARCKSIKSALVTLEPTSIADRGGFISFLERLIGGCLIFLLGSQLIYYGMKYNGSSSLNSAVWRVVSGLHNLMVYGILMFAVGALVLFVIVPIFFVFLSKPKLKKETPIESKTEELQIQPDQEQIELESEAKQKQTEEQQKLENQRKQEVIRRRRERSANAAVQDALDDFL